MAYITDILKFEDGLYLDICLQSVHIFGLILVRDVTSLHICVYVRWCVQQVFVNSYKF